MVVARHARQPAISERPKESRVAERPAPRLRLKLRLPPGSPLFQCPGCGLVFDFELPRNTHFNESCNTAEPAAWPLPSSASPSPLHQ
ncbi:hypothetical protein H4R19_006029 [Coemansia spiralis]|nr:hypothetical protein H4R19_006029 [Coemansia spiralis]